MPPKLQLDKEAWKWAETTEPDQITDHHVKTGYRLNLKPCPQGACKRNCRGNPLCLNGIGEKPWLAELDLRKFTDFDPELERRNKDAYVGLKNLGATCYVNTFLQLWFHNRPVRQAIFKWRDPDQPDIISEGWTPSTICGQLQLIFSLLKYTEKRYIDPSSFINHLGLDTALQQDAQEFSKLFLNLLEESLAKSSQLNIIQEQFRGQYNYVITCSKCESKSATSSTFYELDLNVQGHKSLNQAIENFLQEELLEGENQYMCSNCHQKQDAKRAIKLVTIPPVLNLQLLRFVFDKKTGHKKKLNSFIQFPETLDMSKYLGQPENTSVYYLKAVLIHSGPSAYSGHYTAHILSEDGSAWYRFNDEKTDKMLGKKLQLGAEEDVQDNLVKEQKEPKTTKGFHSSKNAYMLVYSLQKPNKTVESEDETVNEYNMLSPVVRDYVAKDNENFNKWISEILSSRQQNIDNGRAEQSEVQTIYKQMLTNVDNLAEMEWISCDWLMKWLNLPSKAPAIDNSSSLCPHKKLDPDAVHKMKCISSDSANRLYAVYGGGPRLKGVEVLCWECVEQRCKIIRLKIKMAVDDQKISMGLKNVNKSNSWCWVGKTSLRSWKKIALCSLENGLKKTDSSPTPEDLNGSTDNIEPEDQGISDLIFNTDLLCDLHDNLSADEGCRKLVPDTVWDVLSSYFPHSQKFHLGHPVCQQCQTINEEKSNMKLQKKKLVDQQKSGLLDLYMDRRRPTLDDPNVDQMYIISQTFVDSWRKYIKDGGRSPPVSCVNNQTLMCQHNQLILSPAELNYHSDVVLLWNKEWETLCRFASCDVEIILVRYQDEKGESNLLSIPEVCKECQAVRQKLEEDKRFQFTNSVIYVCKQTTADLAKLTNGSSQSNKELIQDISLEPPDKMQKLENEVDMRRKSQRRRKVRGEKEITVSSDMTLKDLKIKIMGVFSVPPFDQNLTVDGRLLDDTSSTLQYLRLYPGCTIFLQVDEPCEDSNTIEELLTPPTRQEQGFKGTNLLSGY